MKQDFAMKWADALEFGEYEQCRGALYNGNGYCCLGVACIVAGEKFTLEGYVWGLRVDGGSYVAEFVLPNEVMQKIGMQSNCGKYYKEDGVTPQFLTEDNDTAKKTFKEIAQIVRDHWEEL